jgi:hypothetical protein
VLFRSKDFLALPKDRQKSARQAAKAVNFGFPGGLGVERFVYYAKSQYGVSVSPQEAKRHKKAWVDAYPEMKDYLGDVTAKAIATNLRLPLKDIEKAFAYQFWDLRDAVSGDYDRETEEGDRLYSLFLRLKSRAEIKLKSNHYLWLMWEQGPSHELADWLFSYPASTLTGRVRAGCGYTDGKNTPFQGLAADGGKEAVWSLLYLGFDIKAFIHDEVIVQVEEKWTQRDAKRVSDVMVKAMERVCAHNVPVACEATISNRWSK